MGEHIRDEVDELLNLYRDHVRIFALSLRLDRHCKRVQPPVPNAPSAASAFWRKIARMSMARGTAPRAKLPRYATAP